MTEYLTEKELIIEELEIEVEDLQNELKMRSAQSIVSIKNYIKSILDSFSPQANCLYIKGSQQSLNLVLEFIDKLEN